jgi:hypothetical protein
MRVLLDECIDRNLPYQQNLAVLDLAVLVLVLVLVAMTIALPI